LRLRAAYFFWDPGIVLMEVVPHDANRFVRREGQDRVFGQHAPQLARILSDEDKVILL